MINIHMGNVVKKKIKERGINIKDFAEALHCHRSNVYSIFDRKIIDFHLLKSISKILDYELLDEFQPNDSQSKYILLIEVDYLKMLEIQSDPLVKIWYVKNV